VYGADVIRVRQRQNVRDRGWKALIEKDIKEEGRKNSPLQDASSNVDNKMARGRRVTNNTFMVKKHARQDFNRSRRQASTC
jgi:hypothetical protein